MIDRGENRGIVARTRRNGRTVFYVRLAHHGHMYFFGPYASEELARRAYAEGKDAVKNDTFDPEQYQRGDVLTKSIHAYRAAHPTRSKTDDARYAAFWQARLGGKLVKQLSVVNILTAKEHLTQKGLAPQTVKHYLSFLRRVLNAAILAGKLDRSPFLRVTMPTVPKGRLRFLSIEEERRLYLALPVCYRPWVRLAIILGLRRGEQFRLKWADLNLEDRLVTLTQTKAGECQYVHLNEEARRLFQGMAQQSRSVWVFESQSPDQHLDPDNFYHRVYGPALKRAKLSNVTWHTLRHTFASRLAMNGATESDIAACLRHSGTGLVKRYAHLSPSHLKGIMEKVSAFGKEAKTTRASQSVDESEIGETSESQGLPKLLKFGAGDGI